MPKSDQKPTPAVDKRLVLVVEDELINREILGMMLQDTYKLLFAETGAQALELLDTYCSTLSIVLLDLNLPDMRGMDILRGMKQSDRTALIPVIVMTADEESEVECLILGATDFIAKPYPKQEIVLARIHRTIELFEDRDIIRWTECDHLTGLYNREFFYRYAAQYDIHHPDVPTDAIVLNVNHFHMINERYGRAVGDEVLKAIAEQLQLMADESGGIACHLEADAFMAYCPHRSDYNDFLQAVCVKAGDGHRVRVRMGVYSNVDRDVDIERRFDRAKQAADTVRNSYTPAIGAYDISMHEKELYHEQLLEDFHAAINEGQFTVYYQPKFDVRTPEPTLSSSEALVRWFHPSLGMVSPAVFIPLFEGNGMIRELDSFVWEEAAKQAAAWKRRLGKTIPVSVNVSRIDLNDPSLQQMLERIVDEAGLKRNEFMLEITESAYTDNAEQAIGVVKTLRENGFFVEMDDFGTGYSSLNMLTSLPIDALKLDMQFIRAAFSDRRDTRLIEGVIRLAHSLNLPTIVEGVETEEQMLALKAMGCDLVQGYYFSRPLPAGEFEAFVEGLG